MRRVMAVLVAVAVALSLMGAAVAATKSVRAKGEKWRPVHTYIGRGDKVRWTNPTNATHDIKGYGGWSYNKILRPGNSGTRTFRQRGTFRFRCVRHSAIVGGRCQGMCGIVHVVG
jgi:plastocyanin